MGDVVYVRGEGGAVFAMDPARMNEGIKQRLAKGYLKVVNPDGSQLSPEVAVQKSPARPSPRDSKADWVTYAVNVLGMDPEDAEAATKQDLIDLAGE